jgi:hypothetical protein
MHFNLVKTIIFYFLFISRPNQALEINQKIENIMTQLNAEQVDYKKACASCQALRESPFNKSTLDSKVNNQKVELSVVDISLIEKIFKEIKSNSEFAFDYTPNGCYAAAHMMAKILDEHGITSGKAFVEGKINVEWELIKKLKNHKNLDPKLQNIESNVLWSYHVAPVVLSKMNGKIIPIIIDPTLFNEPVSFKEWKEKMIKAPHSKIVSEYFTSRFAYDLEDKTKKLKKYDESQVTDAVETLTENVNFQTAIYDYLKKLDQDDQGQK